MLCKARPALLIALVLACACQPGRARPAAFRVRPDSVEAGNLRGPFDGRVLDGATGDPVAGALVYGAWSFERGMGALEPAGFHETVVSTDASGRYRIGRLGDIPSGARVTDFQLVVYKRGYVAYRSDRRFDDLGPRLDFAQRQNAIQLDRWRADQSHVAHVRYVGGGAALGALTAWEAAEAAAELSGQHAGPRMSSDLIVGAAGKVVAAQLLSDADVKSITRFDGGFETGPLNDEPDTDAYSSQHFKALGQPESFDVALRLWRLGPAEAEARYKELLESLPGATESGEIADLSLRAGEKQIFGVGFVDRSRGVVVLLTCGEAQCKSHDLAVALARKAYDKIKIVAPPAAPAAPEVP